MPLSMHSVSVPVFVRTLEAMLGWLDKAESFAEARGFDPANYLDMRLAPDMIPFARQIEIASDAAKDSVARLAGLEPPKWESEEASLDGLRERIRKTIEFVQSVPAEKLEGSEEREILLPAGPDRTLTFVGEAFLKDLFLPSFYLHAATTYVQLRQAGVEMGKSFLGPIASKSDTSHERD